MWQSMNLSLDLNVKRGNMKIALNEATKGCKKGNKVNGIQEESARD